MPSSLRPLLLSTLLGLSATTTIGACDAGYEGSDPGADKADILEESNGYNQNPLLLEFEGPFDMCVDPPDLFGPGVDYGVDLNAAKWLSFMAANEYAHYAHFAPVLEQMGFGDPGEGEAWVEDGRHILELRKLAENEVIEPLQAAQAERALVQEVRPGKKIQFFAAGEIRREKFRDHSTQMMWVEHRTQPLVIISFRGTEVNEGKDLLADANILFKKVEGYGKVHRGFLNAYEGIEEMLKAKLEAESGRDLTIWITGHSLGGALASVASSTVLEHLKEDESYRLGGIYTFGQPRTGNDDFADILDEGYLSHGINAMRFRNGNDLVSQIPGTLLGYEHAGRLMHMHPGELLETDAADQEPGGSDAHLSGFGDHSIDTQYYPNIVEHLKAGEPARFCNND